MAFDPSDLDSIIAWWRSEDIPSGTPDPLNWDDVISSWRLSATGGAIPAYIASAINGLPGLDFSGSGNRLSTTATKSLSGQIAVAYVGDFNLKNYVVPWSFTSNNPPNYSWATRLCQFCYSNGTSQLISNRSAVYHFWSANPCLSSSPQLWAAVWGSEQTSQWVDGDVKLPNNVSGGANGSVADLVAESLYFHMGSTGYSGGDLDGTICELVVWNEPKGFTKHRLHVEGYLAHKYGIALPTAHPFYSAAPTDPPSSGGNVIIIDEGIL